MSNDSQAPYITFSSVFLLLNYFGGNEVRSAQEVLEIVVAGLGKAEVDQFDLNAAPVHLIRGR
jgi:hypothetical protein